MPLFQLKLCTREILPPFSLIQVRNWNPYFNLLLEVISMMMLPNLKRTYFAKRIGILFAIVEC